MAHHNSILKSKKKHLTLDELHLNKNLRTTINQLLEEFTYLKALSKLQIPVDNKVLLHGHTGCGKTATANAIGLALNKNVITINLGGFVSSRLGETAKNLSDIFKQASQDKAVLFIDEFDFIGKLRDYDEKDSGEMKRLVNTLIQQIDQLPEQCLLICATNHIEIIDTALLRRFQIKLNYELPSKDDLDHYYDSLLSQFPEGINQIHRTYGISYAEAKDITFQQIKTRVIQLEKEKRHRLFVYEGFTPKVVENRSRDQQEDVTEAIVKNYKLHCEDFKNSYDESNTMPTQQMAVISRNETDQIKGMVYEITGAELMQLDKETLSTYKRVMETTSTGDQLWLYVSKNSF